MSECSTQSTEPKQGLRPLSCRDDRLQLMMADQWREKMSSKQDLSKPHKCLTEKCKGNLVDPRKSYGRWAYWWGDGSNGWHNAPKSEWGAPLHWSDILRAHVATGLFVNETRIRKAILEQINLGNVRQDGRGLYQFRISLDPYYGDKEVA